MSLITFRSITAWYIRNPGQIAKFQQWSESNWQKRGNNIHLAQTNRNKISLIIDACGKVRRSPLDASCWEFHWCGKTVLIEWCPEKKSHLQRKYIEMLNQLSGYCSTMLDQQKGKNGRRNSVRGGETVVESSWNGTFLSKKSTY